MTLEQIIHGLGEVILSYYNVQADKLKLPRSPLGTVASYVSYIGAYFTGGKHSEPPHAFREIRVEEFAEHLRCPDRYAFLGELLIGRIKACHQSRAADNRKDSHFDYIFAAYQHFDSKLDSIDALSWEKLSSQLVSLLDVIFQLRHQAAVDIKFLDTSYHLTTTAAWPYGVSDFGRCFRERLFTPMLGESHSQLSPEAFHSAAKAAVDEAVKSHLWAQRDTVSVAAIASGTGLLQPAKNQPATSVFAVEPSASKVFALT